MKRATLLFCAAVAFQALILAGIPAEKIHTRLTGTPVLLKTAPIDPYNIMSGYFVVLSYVISNPEGVPGWKQYDNTRGDIFVVLEPDLTDELGSWKAVRVSRDLPADLAPGQAVIKGRNNGWRIEFGIETYYIPETMRGTLDDLIRKNRENVRVAVKIAPSGASALTGMKIGTSTYDY
ncbi:MAG: GDYXXLXY domain-containing protein [Planctomycetota bacterium]